MERQYMAMAKYAVFCQLWQRMTAFSSAPTLLTWRGRVSAIHFTVSGASSKLRLLT